MFANQIFDKGLVSSTYKELSKLKFESNIYGITEEIPDNG